MRITYRWYENATRWDFVIRTRTFADEKSFNLWYDANWNRVEIVDYSPTER